MFLKNGLHRPLWVVMATSESQMYSLMAKLVGEFFFSYEGVHWNSFKTLIELNEQLINSKHYQHQFLFVQWFFIIFPNSDLYKFEKPDTRHHILTACLDRKCLTS